VREAFEQARAAAIRAAGELDDPEAVAVFGDLLASSDSSRESWYAAAWSLARSSAPAAAEHMRRFAVPEQEGLIATLACAALARTGTPGSAGDLPRVSRMAAQTSHPLQRRVCSFAEASRASSATSGPRPDKRGSPRCLRCARAAGRSPWNAGSPV